MALIKRVILVLLLMCNVCHGSMNAFPKGVEREVYCFGCEAAMKVFDRLLRSAPKDQLDQVVAETVGSVCEADNMDLTEYSTDSLSEACNHFIDSHADLLEAVLVSHFSQTHSHSYLDLIHQVCVELTGACEGTSHSHHTHSHIEDTAKVVLNQDSGDFKILPGKNLKMPKPVSESRDEF